MSDPGQPPPPAPRRQKPGVPVKKLGRAKTELNFLGKDGKFHPSVKMRGAVLAIIQREKLGYPLEFRLVANENGVKLNSLRRMMTLHRQGKLELASGPSIVEKQQVELASSNERIFQFLKEYELHLVSRGEILLKRAKAEAREKDGDQLAFKRLGVTDIVSALESARRLRNSVEKGNFAALEELMQLQQRRQVAEELSGTQRVQSPTLNITQINMTDPAQPAEKKLSATELLTNRQAIARDVLSKIPQIKECILSVPETPPNGSQ